MAPTATYPSITVNCPRTHSNLLHIEANEEGVTITFLQERWDGTERAVIGATEKFLYADNPDLRDIVRITPFDEVWNTDLLWALATMHEDHAVTILGHYALSDDNFWQAETAPDFTNVGPEVGAA